MDIATKLFFAVIAAITFSPAFAQQAAAPQVAATGYTAGLGGRAALPPNLDGWWRMGGGGAQKWRASKIDEAAGTALFTFYSSARGSTCSFHNMPVNFKRVDVSTEFSTSPDVEAKYMRCFKNFRLVITKGNETEWVGKMYMHADHSPVGEAEVTAKAD